MPKFHPPTPHYDRAAIQPIDFAEAWLSQPGYSGYEGALILMIIKYLCRYPFKGTPVEDIHKAGTYLGWLKEYVLTKRPGNAIHKGPEKISGKGKKK